MTTNSTDALTAVPAAILTLRSTRLADPSASQLIGLGRGGGRYALRHAVKLAGEEPTELRDQLPGADPALTRWLVWLGDSAPPDPPTHVRIAPLDPVRGRSALANLATDLDLSDRVSPTVFGGILLSLHGKCGGGQRDLLTMEFDPASTDPAGLPIMDVRSGTELCWRELRIHDGRRLAHRDLDLLGLVAEPHHRQLLDTEDQPVLLIRPAPGLAGQQ
jgi:hypothetical protein